MKKKAKPDKVHNELRMVGIKQVDDMLRVSCLKLSVKECECAWKIFRNISNNVNV
jgi:hypothetical protein